MVVEYDIRIYLLLVLYLGAHDFEKVVEFDLFLPVFTELLGRCPEGHALTFLVDPIALYFGVNYALAAASGHIRYVDGLKVSVKVLVNFLV